MAAQIPEARSLASWEDAFQHPLPVVRKLEQQLRRNIEENRQKLRTLVGGSYRDLLGTAERIVEMDEQIQSVESHLGDIGRKCNARMLERIGSNHGRLLKDRGVTDQAKYRVIAQTKVLQSTLAVTLRIIKANGNALLASKLLVLARLLHKSLAEQAESSDMLESLAKKMRLARKRLLSYIGRALVQTEADKTSTVEKLCAYSLISSASPRDVLRYFLQVRFEELELKADAPSEEELVQALDQYQRTLADTRELFPKRFSESLTQVSDTALIRDSSVRAVSELSLDVYEQWIAENVRKFMPWTHHEPVMLAEVKDALSSWTRQAQGCLLQGLTETLEKETELQRVMELRQHVLSKYLSLSVKFQDGAHVQAIDRMRAAFLAKMDSLVQKAARMADTAFQPIPATSIARAGDVSNLWSLATKKFDLGRGAMPFRAAVLGVQHGRTEAVQDITRTFDEWVAHVERTSELVQSLRAVKWDNDIDLDLDEFDDGETIIATLTKQDPQSLDTTLQDALTRTLRSAYQSIQEGSSSGTPLDALFSVRVLRELDQRRRRLDVLFRSLDQVGADASIISGLHGRIAADTANAALLQLKQLSTMRTAPPAVTLWDGSPPLPVQPSPGLYRFLTTLHRQMSSAGVDIWSPAAVQALKTHLTERITQGGIFDVMQEDSSGNEKVLVNGDSTAASEEPAEAAEDTAGVAEADTAKAQEVQTSIPGSADSQRERHIQQTFDALYLQRILGIAPAERKADEPLQDVVQRLVQHLALDSAAQERLRKVANEYWRRTALLFGLLAN